jgi:hypothetical protein
MGGQLGGGRRGRAVGQLRLVGERLGQGGVEPGPFPGQQVGVDDLAEQGVTNLVAVEVGHCDQQLAANGGPQRLDQALVVEADDGGQQPVGRVSAGHRDHL